MGDWIGFYFLVKKLQKTARMVSIKCIRTWHLWQTVILPLNTYIGIVVCAVWGPSISWHDPITERSYAARARLVSPQCCHIGIAVASDSLPWRFSVVASVSYEMAKLYLILLNFKRTTIEHNSVYLIPWPMESNVSGNKCRKYLIQICVSCVLRTWEVYVNSRAQEPLIITKTIRYVKSLLSLHPICECYAFKRDINAV